MKFEEQELKENVEIAESEVVDSNDSQPAENDKQKQPKQKKPWSKKKNTIFWSVGTVLSLTIGVGVGYILATLFNGGNTADYSKINANDYAVDYEALEKKYKSLGNVSDYTTSGLTPCEMANLSLQLFCKNDNWMTQGFGKTTYNVFGVSGDQQIRSTFMKNGNKYFEESLSKSNMVKAAWRMYEDYSSGENSVVERYSGDLKKDIYDSYFDESNKTEYTREEYKKSSGRYLDGIPCIYIISDKCLSGEDQEQTSGIETGVTKTSSGYTVELELNPKITVKNYVVQMQATADLAGAPSFTFVHLTFKLDKKLNPISMTNYEKYYAKTSAGAGSWLTAKVTTYFDSSGDNVIPKINEQTQYDKTKE